jgi:hypothetical protein
MRPTDAVGGRVRQNWWQRNFAVFTNDRYDLASLAADVSGIERLPVLPPRIQRPADAP